MLVAPYVTSTGWADPAGVAGLSRRAQNQGQQKNKKKRIIDEGQCKKRERRKYRIGTATELSRTSVQRKVSLCSTLQFIQELISQLREQIFRYLHCSECGFRKEYVLPAL